MGTLKINGNISATGTISASSFLGNASSATYTYQWASTETNPSTNSTDSNTTTFNKPNSRIYWVSSSGVVLNQPSTWGYILDIGNNAERHQIWMTQNIGSLYHRGGNSQGWGCAWTEILDSSNYTSYTVTKTGDGASGTWNISINGNAHNANYLDGYDATSFAMASHTHNLLTAGGEGSTATKRDNHYSCAVLSGGWNSNDAGYSTTYGTTLDISGYSTWYHRLAFGTNGTIEYWHGINTNTMTRIGYLLTTANYTSYCMPASSYVSINNSDPGSYAVMTMNGRVDMGCLLLTNTSWTGYGSADPESAGLSKVVGRVYFKIG